MQQLAIMEGGGSRHSGLLKWKDFGESAPFSDEKQNSLGNISSSNHPSHFFFLLEWLAESAVLFRSLKRGKINLMVGGSALNPSKIQFSELNRSRISLN